MYFHVCFTVLGLLQPNVIKIYIRSFDVNEFNINVLIDIDSVVTNIRYVCYNTISV